MQKKEFQDMLADGAADILSKVKFFNEPVDRTLRAWREIIFFINSNGSKYPELRPDTPTDILEYLTHLMLAVPDHPRFRKVDFTKRVDCLVEVFTFYKIEIYFYRGLAFIRANYPVITTEALGDSFLFPMRIYLKHLDHDYPCAWVKTGQDRIIAMQCLFNKLKCN